MSDRSDEVTESRDPDAPATDDLLEETDQLLSEAGVDTGDGPSEPAGSSLTADDVRSQPAPDFDRGGDGDLERDPATDPPSDSGTSRSWLSPLRSGLSPLTSRLSLERYFSPKAYLVLVLAMGASFLAGATVSPIAGRMVGMVGMFAAAFAVGVIASKRRYLEMTAAGASVGGVAAILNHAVLAAVGSGQRLVAVGATVGLLATVVGYYFGRDLRDGLSKDID